MSGLDALAEAQRPALELRGDPDRARVTPLGVVLEGALATHGREDRPRTRLGPRGVHRQGRAAQHAQHHLSVFDQRQRDRVLLRPQEPLGPVDRVQGPEAAAGSPLVAAAIDRVEHGRVIQLRERRLGGAHHPPGQGLALRAPQRACVLFAQQRKAWESRGEAAADDGLDREVGHRHRRLVPLLQRAALDQGGLDGEADADGLRDRLDGDAGFGAEVHSGAPGGVGALSRISERTTLPTPPLPEPSMIVFAHGLEGTPEGSKVQALRAAGFPVDAPDGQGMVLADRIPGLREALLRHADRAPGERLVLAGSSYGGLAAAWLAVEQGHRLDGLLLLAPALHHREPPASQPEALVAPPAVPTVIIHSRDDDIVPISVSRAYLAASRALGRSVELIEVDGDHALRGQLEVIVEQAGGLLGR